MVYYATFVLNGAVMIGMTSRTASSDGITKPKNI